MTTTVTFGNIPSASPTDVAIYFLDQSKLDFVKQVVSADGLNTTAYFAYADGDPALETRVIVTRRDDPKQGLIHHTVRLETLQTVDDGTDVTEEAIAAATIGVSVPGPMEDTAKVLSFIGAAFSLWFNGVTAKVPNSGNINKMNFATIQSLW